MPDLVAPVLLIALPQVTDPFFRKSVILLLVHEDEGSLGFIVNRPTELRLAATLSEMELEWGGDAGDAVQFGGPVEPQVGTVLFATDAAGRELSHIGTEVLPGLRLSQNFRELKALSSRPPRRFRLLLGHAGWGAGQLVSEILRNDWMTAPPEVDLVFGADSDATWEAGLRSVGVDPTTLPAWTASDDGAAAN